jgi:predicted ATPase
MLTRLKVSGFKNLVDVDVSFGPFTCIAGANAVGKSNLFDAITFLAALADRPLLDAALSVRSDEQGRGGDVKPIFRHVGNVFADEMSFEAEMLVPRTGIDDLGQEARASITFLRYALTIGRRSDSGAGLPALEIRKEELVHIKLDEAKRHLPFEHKYGWRRSVATGRRTSPFISTDPGKRQIKLHGDLGTGGRPRLHQAAALPRTVLSSASAAESPTALLARREMQSWRLLQLEPSAMRAPDPYTAPSRMDMHGAHLPATLARLAAVHPRGSRSRGESEAVYSRIANRLAELVEGIRTVRVEPDVKKELLSLVVTDRDGTEHEARALSDGTLRFLALAVLEADPEAVGLLCLEEPENGIHPERIGAMLRLLRDLAVDPFEPVDADNPLRQVIINTHSPAVVSLVPEDALIHAALEPREGKPRSYVASLRWLGDTWRARSQPSRAPLSKGELLGYLDPIGAGSRENAEEPTLPRRVASRKDLQVLLPFPATPSVHE